MAKKKKGISIKGNAKGKIDVGSRRTIKDSEIETHDEEMSIDIGKDFEGEIDAANEDQITGSQVKSGRTFMIAAIVAGIVTVATVVYQYSPSAFEGDPEPVEEVFEEEIAEPIEESNPFGGLPIWILPLCASLYAGYKYLKGSEKADDE